MHAKPAGVVHGGLEDLVESTAELSLVAWV
jgi:hypothetical protein